MIPFRHPALDSLAVRFSLLLAGALVVANLVAAVLLLADDMWDSHAALAEREVERVVSLVPAIEAAPQSARASVADDASTRFSRVSVDPEPIVDQIPTAPRSAELTRRLADALGPRDVRAAIMVRAGEDGKRGEETVALSIRLGDEDGPDQWLNSVSRGDRGGPSGVPEEVLFLVLGASLASVLGVALVFLRRLTRPLAELATAARAAGQGDRSVRVAETGPKELRDASAAFNEMQDRIARFDAERMRTLAAVGHDLRTPITSLRIRAEMLDDEDAAPMIRTLDEMTVMANGLITYARGAGDGEEVALVDLSDLLSHLSEDRGATYTPSGPVHVRARPVALGRAIGNLIDNALRYGAAARITLRRGGDAAFVTIVDDGPGIAPERLEEVLEPFVRGEDSRNLETGGAGLGLSIARNIIVSHGGNLQLENRSAGGLRVTVRLPLASRP